MKLTLTYLPIYEETGVPEGSDEPRNRNLRLRGVDENGVEQDVHIYDEKLWGSYDAKGVGDEVEI